MNKSRKATFCGLCSEGNGQLEAKKRIYTWFIKLQQDIDSFFFLYKSTLIEVYKLQIKYNIPKLVDKSYEILSI